MSEVSSSGILHQVGRKEGTYNVRKAHEEVACRMPSHEMLEFRMQVPQQAAKIRIGTSAAFDVICDAAASRPQIDPCKWSSLVCEPAQPWPIR